MRLCNKMCVCLETNSSKVSKAGRVSRQQLRGAGGIRFPSSIFLCFFSPCVSPCVLGGRDWHTLCLWQKDNPKSTEFWGWPLAWKDQTTLIWTVSLLPHLLSVCSTNGASFLWGMVVPAGHGPGGSHPHSGPGLHPAAARTKHQV